MARPRKGEVRELSALQLFDAKNKYMSNIFPEVSAMEFYADIFRPEECEKKGDLGSRGSNPIITYLADANGNPAHLSPMTVYARKDRGGKSENGGDAAKNIDSEPGAKTETTDKERKKDEDKDGKKNKQSYYRNEILFSDTFAESIKKVQGCTFALCSMCSYSGRRRSAKNAYRCHGFCIDLDGVGMRELEDFWGWVQDLERIPVPTFVANSGHGLHVYYVFENPVPLYPAVASQLQRLKRGLTEWVWNKETSSYPIAERQYQGIYQSFRMIGSLTKIGRGKSGRKVRAWRTGKRVTLEYLNSFVDEEFRCPVDPDYSSWEWADGEHFSLEECREKWPDWYQRRIIENQPGKQWICDHALYDWWLARIQKGDGARDGTRYHCISCLYIYAVKCGIAKEFVDADAEGLIPQFNALTRRPDNEFTEKDVRAAAAYFDPKFSRMTRKEIARRSGIDIPPRRRNGRSQEEHLKRARLLRTLSDYSMVGAPSKKEMVKEWRASHPDGRKIDCERETGLSRHTVIKWWDN